MKMKKHELGFEQEKRKKCGLRARILRIREGKAEKTGSSCMKNADSRRKSRKREAHVHENAQFGKEKPELLELHARIPV